MQGQQIWTRVIAGWDDTQERRPLGAGVVIIYDGEERRHRRQIVIRRLALQELDDRASHTPYI